MARCAREACRRWRPDAFVRLARVGARLDDEWFCSASCLEAALRARLDEEEQTPRGAAARVPRLKLGMVLLHRRLITTEALSAALLAQRDSGLKLGAQLKTLGAASSQDILQGLASQCGVSCLTALDPARVASGPGRLSRDVVRALGVVPFGVDNGRQQIMVACSAPIPQVALRALGQLTGLKVEPFLVADEQLEQLVEAYGRDAGTAAAPRPVRDIPDAAAQIARVARTGDIHLATARCDPFLWVRVRKGERIEEMVLPVADVAKERAWQAVPT